MQLPRRRLLQFAGAMALGSLARPAHADTYPSRVVKFIVGFPPGGGADLATRIVAAGLSDIWHQQTIVENKPGAGARLALAGAGIAPGPGAAVLQAHV
jgi:tripartite-type tricarboxylate transporter receptor subunit TctC